MGAKLKILRVDRRWKSCLLNHRWILSWLRKQKKDLNISSEVDCSGKNYMNCLTTYATASIHLLFLENHNLSIAALVCEAVCSLWICKSLSVEQEPCFRRHCCTREEKNWFFSLCRCRLHMCQYIVSVEMWMPSFEPLFWGVQKLRSKRQANKDRLDHYYLVEKELCKGAGLVLARLSLDPPVKTE